MTVPPAIVAANRIQLASLVVTNVFGQNTAAIAANEAQYGEMWAQDAAAMYSYAGNSAAAAQVTPFTEAPQTTNPAGSGVQSAAVTQAAGTAAGNSQASLSGLISQALQSLATPASSASSGPGLSGLLSGPRVPWSDWRCRCDAGSALARRVGLIRQFAVSPSVFRRVCRVSTRSGP